MPEETQDKQGQSDTAENAADKAAETPQNTVTIADAGTLRKKVTVAIPRERIDEKFDEMFGQLSQTAQVPGFRLGRAPRRLLEKRFGKEVSEDVRNAMVGESIGEAIEKAELNTMGEPDINLDEITLPESGELSFEFEVDVAPEFELPELKGTKIQKRTVKVTDKLVNEHLEQWAQRYATFEATSGAAAEGDLVTADATISGEGISPLEHKELTLRVAPGQIEGLPLVDLAEALSGSKAGGTASLSLKVPEAHPNEDWQGKELTVDLAISQVRRRVLPKIDEAFARSAGFDSVDQLRREVSRNLEFRVLAETQRAMRDQLRRYLLDNTQLELPEATVKRYTIRFLQRRYVELLNMGIPKEQIEENITKLKAAASHQAQRDVKLLLILNKIAEAENMDVGDEEVNARIAEMARQYDRRPERFRQELEKDGSLSAVKDALLDEKVLDMLVEQAEVTEVSDEVSDEKDIKKTGTTASRASGKKAAGKKSSKKRSSKKS